MANRMALTHRQHDVEKRFDVLPIQVDVAFPSQQLMRHIRWSPGPLLRRLGVVRLEGSRPR